MPLVAFGMRLSDKWQDQWLQAAFDLCRCEVLLVATFAPQRASLATTGHTIHALAVSELYRRTYTKGKGSVESAR
jgi:hypothetical protein